MKHVLSFLSFGAEWHGVMRGLVRRPGYALAALAMLGLAVAANTAVFAIVYGFMLKPLPYAQPGRLVVVRERIPGIGLNTPLVSVPTYLALKRNLRGISAAGLATWPDRDVVKIGGRPQLLGFEQVTPSLFRTLGVAPVLGRLPADDADQPDGPAEAVISYRLWQGTYGASRDVLDQRLTVAQKSYRIVGVMPRDFFLESADNKINAWLPFVMTPARVQNTNINYWMIVRRKPGVSLHRLNLELGNQLQLMLAKEKPKRRADDIKNGYTIDARSLRRIELDQSGVGKLPWLLQAAACLLLLLALANTVNLGLVRQRTRQHEFALRRALGSDRGRLVRMILIEHFPLALAIGAMATLLAWASVAALHAFGLPPAVSPFHVNLAPAVIAFCWALTGVAVLIAACGPALMATGRRLLDTLGHGPTATGGKGSRLLQRALGVVQVAFACALIVAGALLGTSLWRILSQPVGFEPQHLTTATVELPDGVDGTAAWAALKPRLTSLPGVNSAAIAGMLPFSGDHAQGGIRVLGRNNNIIVNLPLVGAGFFPTMKISFVAGRGYTSEEIAHQAPVVVVNEWLAEHFFGSADKAIGQTLDIGKKLRIVGVTRNIAWAPTPDQDQPGTAYLTYGLFPEGFNVVVRSRGMPGPRANEIKRTIQNVLPGSVVIRIDALSRTFQGASIFRAAGAGLVGAFASLAVLLAALGVFAITALIARGRLGEYGIRAALGAGPGALLRLGFGEAGWLLAVGLPLGLLGAWLLGRVIASALYRTPVLDPGLYLAGAAAIAGVVLVAAWGPARHAAHTPIRNLIGGGTQ